MPTLIFIYMARLNSFYLSPDEWHSPFELKNSEAKHLCKVLRAKVGDTIRLFDGKGREGLFEINSISKNKTNLTLLEEKVTPEFDSLALAIGWNKSSRRNWILEKSVELQTKELIFFQSEFSQGKVPSEPKENWLEKMISAAKQCGNPYLPVCSTISGNITNLIEATTGFEHKLFMWEKADNNSLVDNATLSKKSTIAVIGPEGGFSENEATLLIQAGFKPLSLGKSILRWETAALLCMGSSYLNKQGGEA